MFRFIGQENIKQSLNDVEEMFRQRKRVFVDTLRWDLKCHGDQEIDEYDTPDATYLIMCDPESGRQLSSCRFIAMDKPNLMSDLFSEYCADGVPVGPNIWEITRYCINPEIRGRAAHRSIMGRMSAAILEIGLNKGVDHLIFLSTMLIVPHLLTFGWKIEPLGLPKGDGHNKAVALRATVDQAGLSAIRENFNLKPLLTFSETNRKAA